MAGRTGPRRLEAASVRRQELRPPDFLEDVTQAA